MRDREQLWPAAGRTSAGAPAARRARSVTIAWLLSILALSAGADPATERRVPAGLTPEKHLREFSLSRWTIDDGLLTNALTNVLQTRDGYLWIASYNGLMRFDGLGFTVFDQTTVPVFGTSGFHELVEDRQGDLWLGLQSVGVRRYRDGRFETVGGSELGFTVRTLRVEAAGEAWAGTGDFGAFRWAEGAWTSLEHPALAGVTVRDILRSRDGALWFATEGKGLTRLENGRFTTFGLASGLASDHVTSLCEAADGALWVGTEEGLSRLAGDEVESVAELAGTEIYRLYLDDYGNLWLAAEQGLLRKNALSGDFERLASHGGEPLRSVSAIAFGREGEVWIAGYLDGLYRLKDGKFKNYTADNGLTTARVNALYQTRSGDVLVGGDGTIDVIFRDGDVRQDGGAGRFRRAKSVPDVRVRDFLEDRAGRLWIASYAGLMRISAGATEWITVEQGLPSNQIRLLYEDGAGNIWAASRNAGAIELAAGGGLRALDKTTGLASDFVLSIDETPGGDLLLGTHEGLDVVRADGSIAHFGLAEGLPGELVFSSLVDRSGAVWLATNGGLARLHRQRVQAFTRDDGLPADSVFDVVEDAGGSLWLSSALGVIRLSKRQLIEVMDGRESRIEATVYDDRDGMANRDCTGAAKILLDRDGRLWFPTLGGVSILDPANLATNPVPPSVRIERFTVDGALVAGARATGAGAGALEIAPGGKTFTFGFAALSLLAPTRVEIRYRLEGFDEEWMDAGPERNVRYTNLSPGDYALRVTAANNDGVWNRQGATLAFRVRPFLYQVPAFQAAAALLIAAAAFGLYRWRMRKVEARSARLQRIVSEQQRTAAALRDSEDRLQGLVGELEAKNAELERFAYTVSHDLKSPLITIGGMLGLLEKEAAAGNADRVGHYAERVRTASRHMSRLLDELLELSRIGRVVNPTEEVRLEEVAVEAGTLLAESLDERGVELEISPGLPVVRGDRTRVLEVFQNLLDNAVRFLGDPPAPRIEIGTREQGGETVCYVRDNGIGVEPRYHDRIFELFERLDPGTEGTGIGLALVKRIVEFHGGRIWVESEGLGHGSTFCFVLPAEGPPAVSRSAESYSRRPAG